MWSELAVLPHESPQPALQVPIENLYYLLCYASQNPSARGLVPVQGLEGPSPTVLYAQILAQGLSRLRRRGLPRRYQDRVEDTRYPRGRVNMGPTVSRALIQQGQVNCTLNELVLDHPINQLFKAAARLLASQPEVPKSCRSILRSHVQFLGQVRDVPLKSLNMTECRRGRLDTMTSFLLNICALVRLVALPRQADGTERLFDVRCSKSMMGAIFESFLREFLRREQREYTVHSPYIDWQAESLDPVSESFLPRMKTDVVLASKRTRILIEAKCTQRMTHQFKGGSPKLRSKHIYQIMNYLEHMKPGPPTVGLLLYAQSGPALRLDLRLGGHELRVRSLNLNQAWTGIHADLIHLIAHDVGGSFSEQSVSVNRDL